MINCYICKEEFKNNTGGQLTNHVKKCHSMTLEDYIILTEYNNIAPKCKCGCEERPHLYRGKFLEYSKGHTKFKHREQEYVSKHGVPLCKTCNNEISFHRGKPNIYCDSGCRPSCWNQKQINKTVKDKYHVDNVMDVKEFRDKISIANKEIWCENYNERLNKMIETNIERYGSAFSCNNKFDRKIYKNTDLKYQSSYEYDFLEFCENNNVLHLIKKSPTFRYLEKSSYHFPDYIYNNRIIVEIKSKWILDLQGGEEIINEKKKSIEKLGYKYILILDKDYFQFEKEILNC